MKRKQCNTSLLDTHGTRTIKCPVQRSVFISGVALYNKAYTCTLGHFTVSSIQGVSTFQGGVSISSAVRLIEAYKLTSHAVHR